MCSAALVRWRHRAYFVILALVGIVIAVGAHPYTDPSTLGGLFKSFAESSSFGLALRSTGRAVPLVALGFAVLLGVGVNALADRWTARGHSMRGLVLAGLLMVLVVANMPAIWQGSFYGQNLLRDENIPDYWTQAIAAMDKGSHQTRVLELPGADFASYRWGNTVDPITPGLMDRPYVARELIPWGSPASADLLNALDRRIQEGVLDPNALVPDRAGHERGRDLLPRRPRHRPLRPGARHPGCGSCCRPPPGSGSRRSSAPRSATRCSSRSTTRSSWRCLRT